MSIRKADEIGEVGVFSETEVIVGSFVWRKYGWAPQLNARLNTDRLTHESRNVDLIEALVVRFVFETVAKRAKWQVCSRPAISRAALRCPAVSGESKSCV